MALVLASGLTAPAAPVAGAGVAHPRPDTVRPATFPTPIQHVIVLWFENKDLGQILREKAPFERYLASHYAYTGQFYSVRHDSEPDYLAGTAGIDPNVFGVGRYHVNNVGDLANAAGETWAGYFESMPSPCYGTYDWPAGYEVTHNPFVQYYDVWHNQAYCRSHVLDLNAWNASFASGSIPNYVMIEPNIFHDQHSGSLGAGDSWLKSVVNPILNSSLMASTAIIVTYDEGVNGGFDGHIIDNSGYNGTAVSDAGQIYTAVVSKYAPHAGYNSSHPYQTYSLLTTAEWLLGLGSTGQNDSWAKFPPMRDMFNFAGGSDTPKGPYTVSGNVTNITSGLPIAGAHVVAADTHYVYGVDTGASGAYSLPITAGTHSLYVCAPNYTCYLGEVAYPLNITGNRTGVDFPLGTQKFPQYRVQGYVTNSSDGVGLSDGQVVFSNLKAALTNATGYYTIYLLNGTYNTTAYAPGYVTAQKAIVVNGHAQTVNFALDPNGTGGNFPLMANATSNVSEGSAPLAVRFTATAGGGQPPYSCTWAFGDNASGSGCTVDHTYTTGGTYVAVVNLSDAGGNTTQANTSVTVFQIGGPPQVSISANVSSGPAPLHVRFTSQVSGGYPPYMYVWNFGDGSQGSNRTNPTHTYGRNGTYTVRLNLTDSTGNRTSNTTVIIVGSGGCTVGCGPPLNATAAISAEGCVATGYQVAFAGTAKGGVPSYNFTWSFGDGSAPVTSQSPTHVYMRLGAFTARLTVTDSKGQTTAASATVTISSTTCIGVHTVTNHSQSGFWTPTTTALVLGGAAVAAIGGATWAGLRGRRPPKPPRERAQVFAES